MSDSIQIKVAIKVRPLIKREKDENLPVQWDVQGNRIFSVDPETKRRGDHLHVFDHIFGMNSNNSDVYEIVRPIVDAAVNGFNGTIFAYGQTSSGKTHTMMGTKDEPGVIPLAVDSMFDAIANSLQREFLLRVSYLEIYNEKLIDLLHENRSDLKIKEDASGQVFVECKEEVTNSPGNVLSVMKKGDKKRRVGETNMNERSSRSHTIFRITIESRPAGTGAEDGAVQVSQLNLVDLAGSERAAQTGATGDRFKEGRHINLSLSSLGLVIKQLSEGQDHVNFRDSKLTRILQTSLGGNAMTTIICAVTPAALEETQCTLAFASRAKSIKNKPKLNEVMSDEVLLKRYSRQIMKLSAELEKSKQTSQCAKVEEMQNILQEKDRHIQLIEGRMELLKTRIVSSANSVENVDFKTKSRRRRTWCGPSNSVFLNQSLTLPTIQEATASESTSDDLKKAQYKRRQSIMQTPVDDLVNEKFQTVVEDFELELLESERNWEMGRLSDGSDIDDNYVITRRKPTGNHVTFQDSVSVFQISYADSVSGSPEKSEPSTPTRSRSQDLEEDSGTPKEVLRERLDRLADEYNKLQEYTVLEKQLYAEERAGNKDDDNMGAILNHMKKSFTDSELICLDTNKKYSDLRDKYYELETKYHATLQDHEALKKQVEKFTGMEETLRLIESEKNQLKLDMETKLLRLKKLEEERNDYEFQVELLESKHKTREAELESSLKIAWSNFADTDDKEKFSNIIKLQTLVDKLTKEVEVLRAESEESKQLSEQQLTENKTMEMKVEEFNTLLINAQDENTKLINELENLKKRLEKTDTDEVENSSAVTESEENISTETLTSESPKKLNENETEATDVIKAEDPESTTESSSVEPLCVKKHIADLTEPESGRLSVKELQSQIKEKSEAMSKLEDLLRVATEDNSNMKTDLESFQRKYEEQNTEINNLEQQVAEIRNSELRVNVEYENALSKINQLTTDNEALVNENDELKAKIAENAEQLKNNETLIDALQMDMDKLKLKLDEKNNQFLDIKAKFEELEQIKDQVEFISTDDNSSRVLSLEKELESYRIKIDEYKSEIITLNNEIGKKSDEITNLNNMLENLGTKDKQLESRLETLQQELNEQTTIKTEFRNETETNNSDLSSSEISCIKTESPKKTLSNNSASEEFNQTNCLNNLSDSLVTVKMQKSATFDTERENIKMLKSELERLTLDNRNLLEENSLLKLRIETHVEETKKAAVEKDLVNQKNQAELIERDSKLHELKDKIINMQKIINENDVMVQRVPKLEATIKDLELMNSELEHMNSELRKNLNIKSMELESIGVQKYESEIQNLKSYVANLQQFNKNIQQENEDLKHQMHDESLNLENDLDNLKQRIAEQEKITHNLVEEKKILMKHIAELSQGKSERDIVVPNKSDSVSEMESSIQKLSPDAKECSSIFANATYFDEMDVSAGDDVTLAESSNVSLYQDENQSGNETVLESAKEETATAKDELSANETANELRKLMNAKILLEDEVAKITNELQLKIQESDEIKNDVQGLKSGIEGLEKTIHLLTTENMEMSNKLTTEKERAKEAEAGYQAQVEDLYQRVSKISEEKVNLESALKICQADLDIVRANTPTGTEDEVRAKIERYQEKIDSLTTENIRLSANLTDKIEELDKIKQCKALLYDHECSYKDEVQGLRAKVDDSTQEINDLSNGLMETLEELDSLKNAYELLENKLALSVKNQLSSSINTSQNELMELKAQNSQLKSENVELQAKVTTLSTENSKYTDNLLETMAALDNSRLYNERTSSSENLSNKSLNLSRNSDNVSTPDYNATEDNIQSLKNKLQAYEEQINHLTCLNKKLSDLKLSTCEQCTHLKELNESRRTLKLEVRGLHHKLQDLQKKFEKKCADTEILRNKACEDLTLSVMSDSMLNGSICESMNVSFVEEKVKSLNTELATLKQTHDKLLSSYEDKCNEVDRLNESNTFDKSLSAAAEPEQPASKNNRARIERVQGDVDKLSIEIQHLKKRNTTLSESLNKFINEKSHLQKEIDNLKESKQELNTKLMNSEMQIELTHEKVSILEGEVNDLNKLVESLRAIEREAKNDKVNFEVEIEVLKTDKIKNHQALEELKISLKSEKENNSVLNKNLEALLKETEELRKENDQNLKTIKAQYQNSQEQDSNKKLEAQIRIEALELKSAQLAEENMSLLSQVKTLQERAAVAGREISSDHSELKTEIENAKEYITKEIKSLKPRLELSSLMDKTVKELQIEFLNIIMMKEQEIIKAVQDRFEQEKQSLEDAKRQSVDAERRVTNWAKELETDIEKLQGDLSSQERKNKKLQHDIERLENDLKESQYEKELLKEKIEVLETDFNVLQAELAKQSEADNKQGKEVNAIQERERVVLAAAKNREIELQNSIKSMKDLHNKKVEELTFALEHQRTKNLELKSNLEGLEANEKQLRSIIDVKSMDFAKLQQRTAVLEAENMQMTETCNQLNESSRNQIQRIEEITNLLKIKCDKLSEYKTKLESILPEHEILKEQIKERKQYAEKYKREYESLKEKAEKEYHLIIDKLTNEEIRTSSLNEQLAELNNRNKILVSELEDMKFKCEELERANEKLEKKVRNSTSNTKVEAQIEDLKDQNAMLKKNAEGASNRITELQESKNAITREHISLQAKYDMLLEEKKELDKIVGSGKVQRYSTDSQLTELNEKLQAQIQEKNRIALELEATKLAVSWREKEVKAAQQEIEGLRTQNKELEEELDELAKEIQERIADTEKLRNELYDVQENTDAQSSKDDKAEKEGQNMKLITDRTEVEILIEQNKELNDKIENINKTADFLWKENSELKSRVTELELKVESRSCSSSRSVSPLVENRRKQRRSDLYNQSRPLDDTLLSTLPLNCRCLSLGQKVRELELEIVTKNGKIATLEMQIQSENFPYQKKCKDLEENLWAFKTKNYSLKEEIKRLQRAISSTSISECEVCRKRQTNKRDQSTQCLPQTKTFMSGTSSGIVEDYAKIQKLEKEKALMRDLCRSRTRHIKELEKKLSEYETLLSEKSKLDVTTASVEDRPKNLQAQNTSSSTLREKSQILGENKRAMKENFSSNILDNVTVVSSNRNKSIWSHYP